MTAIEFRVLGPFEVYRSSSLVVDGTGLRQALLARLLISANRSVSRDQLAVAVWGEDPPQSAGNLVQGYVSYWRNVLDPGRVRRASGARLTSSGGGYCLHVAEEECDLLRFYSSARAGTEAAALGDLYGARRLLHGAVIERRGPPLAEFRQAALAEAMAAFEAQWLDTVEAAADVELHLGRPAAALAYVEPLRWTHPLRESLVAIQMLALYRLGRQADALDAYDQARQALARELGVDPGARLSRLHLDVLHQSASLTGETEATRRPPVLPLRLSSFVGRERLSGEVRDQLESHRLVTLTGPAGSGKTRLAVETAATIAAVGERSVTFVDLAPVQDSDLLWQSVANALGIHPPATNDPDEVVSTLGPTSATLLVLDNMEHLLEAAPSIAAVLARAPLLSLLVTSRESLGIVGEQLVPVSPLPTPRPGDPVDAILNSPAVRLFIARAKDTDPAFVVRDDDVAVLGGICQRLDGLPLTIELAAPLTSTLSLRALLERLDRPVTLLGTRRRDQAQPARHRTLRAALDWSYGTLDPLQRRLFEQLSVFVSGALLEQVEEVTDLGSQAAPVLAELHERNLVYRAGPQEAPRYRQLVTIRDYAGERLGADPDALSAALERHTKSVCVGAEQVSRGLRTNAGAELVGRLRGEQEEIRTVLARLTASGDTTRLLALVVDALPLWWDLGYTREGYQRVTDALAACARDTPEELLAAGNIVAVYLADAVGEPETALHLGVVAADHAMRSGSTLLESLSLCLQGNSRCWLRPDGAAPDDIALLERAAAMAKQAPDTLVRWGWASRSEVLVTVLLVLTDVLRYLDARRARTHRQDLLAVYDLGMSEHAGSFALRASAALDADAGHWDSAQEALETSLELARSAASLRSQSRSLEELARLAWRRDDLSQAAVSADSATRLAQETGHNLNTVRCAGLSADIALEIGELSQAALCIAQAEAASHHQFALHTTAPRRARHARLNGQLDDAETHLTSVAHLEQTAGLSPDRLVYLIEAAQCAQARGQARRAAALAQAVNDAAEQVGIDIPSPERRHLAEVTAG